MGAVADRAKGPPTHTVTVSSQYSGEELSAASPPLGIAIANEKKCYQNYYMKVRLMTYA